MDVEQDSAGVKFAPAAAFIGTLVVGLALGKLLGSPDLPLNHSSERGLGSLATLLGVGIMLSAVGLFRAANTDPKPWKRTTALITDGVYRWSRNPMYFGMALAYAGVAICLDSLVTLLLLHAYHFGGSNGGHQGLRSTPSARYLDQAGAFGFDAQGRPRGGLFWDGRADTRAQQARGPLFNADEMANTDVAALAARLRALPYAAAENIIIAPDCGMKYLPRAVAYGKLVAMVEGTKRVRAKLTAK